MRATKALLARPAARPFGAGSTIALDDESGREAMRQDLKAKIKRIRQDTKLAENEKKAKIAELKLAKELQGLKAKLDKDGNYSKGRVIVRGGKIELAVYLIDMNDKTLDALKGMGFTKILDSPAVKMVLGTIEVSKLVDLAQLDEVRRIELPTLLE